MFNKIVIFLIRCCRESERGNERNKNRRWSFTKKENGFTNSKNQRTDNLHNSLNSNKIKIIDNNDNNQKKPLDTNNDNEKSSDTNRLKKKDESVMGIGTACSSKELIDDEFPNQSCFRTDETLDDKLSVDLNQNLSTELAEECDLSKEQVIDLTNDNDVWEQNMPNERTDEGKFNQNGKELNIPKKRTINTEKAEKSTKTLINTGEITSDSNDICEEMMIAIETDCSLTKSLSEQTSNADDGEISTISTQELLADLTEGDKVKSLPPEKIASDKKLTKVGPEITANYFVHITEENNTIEKIPFLDRDEFKNKISEPTHSDTSMDSLKNHKSKQSIQVVINEEPTQHANNVSDNTSFPIVSNLTQNDIPQLVSLLQITSYGNPKESSNAEFNVTLADIDTTKTYLPEPSVRSDVDNPVELADKNTKKCFPNFFLDDYIVVDMDLSTSPKRKLGSAEENPSKKRKVVHTDISSGHSDENVMSRTNSSSLAKQNCENVRNVKRSRSKNVQQNWRTESLKQKSHISNTSNKRQSSSILANGTFKDNSSKRVHKSRRYRSDISKTNSKKPFKLLESTTNSSKPFSDFEDICIKKIRSLFGDGDDDDDDDDNIRQHIKSSPGLKRHSNSVKSVSSKIKNPMLTFSKQILRVKLKRFTETEILGKSNKPSSPKSLTLEEKLCQLTKHYSDSTVDMFECSSIPVFPMPNLCRISGIHLSINESCDEVVVLDKPEIREIIETIKCNFDNEVIEIKDDIPLVDLSTEDLKSRTVQDSKEELLAILKEEPTFSKTETITLYRSQETVNNSFEIQAHSAVIGERILNVADEKTSIKKENKLVVVESEDNTECLPSNHEYSSVAGKPTNNIADFNDNSAGNIPHQQISSEFIENPHISDLNYCSPRVPPAVLSSSNDTHLVVQTITAVIGERVLNIGDENTSIKKGNKLVVVESQHNTKCLSPNHEYNSVAEKSSDNIADSNERSLVNIPHKQISSQIIENPHISGINDCSPRPAPAALSSSNDNLLLETITEATVSRTSHLTSRQHQHGTASIIEKPTQPSNVCSISGNTRLITPKSKNTADNISSAPKEVSQQLHLTPGENSVNSDIIPSSQAQYCTPVKTAVQTSLITTDVNSIPSQKNMADKNSDLNYHLSNSCAENNTSSRSTSLLQPSVLVPTTNSRPLYSDNNAVAEIPATLRSFNTENSKRYANQLYSFSYLRKSTKHVYTSTTDIT